MTERNMTSFHPFASLFLLLLSTILCQSHALPASWASEAKSVAFFPRGGAIGRRRGQKKVSIPKEVPDATVDTTSLSESEEDVTESNTTPSFDREEASKQLHKEEVAEIKKSQQFLEKQRQRRELDNSWMDKGITAVIEFFENLFSWKVIEV
mmetsp:Transcript_3591/g.7936  ORF Transcript_3591/g.7936 Transcript_3591/m.7936 type:complete len:152 (+) Transcript_3591:82-537(+)